MRLFRQETLGGWGEVFGRMASELRRMVGPVKRRGVARVEMAAGELLDRLTILHIKRERIKEASRRRYVESELEVLERARSEQLAVSGEVEELVAQLVGVNEQLWDVEDSLRECERRQVFGDEFVRLARSVYRLNDRRGELKRKINEAVKAPWSDSKQYGNDLTARALEPAQVSSRSGERAWRSVRHSPSASASSKALRVCSTEVRTSTSGCWWNCSRSSESTGGRDGGRDRGSDELNRRYLAQGHLACRLGVEVRHE